MAVRVPGSVTEVSLQQSLKVWSLMRVTVLGSVMELMALHNRNAPGPISVTVSGTVIEVSLIQCLNAELSMRVKVRGSVREVSSEQLENALHPMVSTLSGTTTVRTTFFFHFSPRTPIITLPSMINSVVIVGLRYSMH